MINVCHQCGMYRADKIIDPDGPYAICPECGYKHPIKLLPLLLVSGASGTGKSAIFQRLNGRLAGAVLLESDLLWRGEFNKPEDNYHDFCDTWLRLCKSISQSGRPVALFGAGTGVPGNIEPLVERRYFSRVEYLALVCQDELLVERLKARPAWRGTQAQEFIEAQLRFNRWFKEYAAEPPIRLVDTTCRTVDEAAAEVEGWILEKCG